MENISNIDSCSCTVVHEDIIKKVSDQMPTYEEMTTLSEFFKVFGDPSRLRIIKALILSEMCVCDLSVLLNMTQSAVSHQLKVLRNSKLVRYRREGKVVYYSLDDEHIKSIFDMGFIHINE